MTLGEKKPRKIATLREQVTQSVLWNVSLLPIRYLLPLVSSVVVVRVLGPKNYGLLASLWAIVATIELWADFGISKSIPKFEAEIRTRWGEAALRDFLGMLIILHGLLFALAAFCVYLFSDHVLSFFSISEHEQTYLLLIAVLLLLDAPKGVLRGVMIARFRNKEINTIDLIKTTLSPALSIGAALAGLGVVGIMASSVVVSAVVLVASILVVCPIVRWGNLSMSRAFCISKAFLRRFVVYSLFTSFVFGFRYFTGPTFMILMMNVFRMQTQVAYFKIASTAILLVQSMATAPLSYTIAGILGRTFLDENYNRLRRVYQTMSRVFLLTMVPLSCGLALLAGPSILLLYGDRFIPATTSLQVMALLLMLATVCPYSASMLQMYERYRELSATGVLGILVSVALSILLIPRLGHVGAALSCGFGAVASSLSGTIVSHKIFGLRYPISFGIRILISSLPMLAYFPLRRIYDSSWYFLVGFIVYAATAFLAVFKAQRGLCASDRELLMQSGIPKVHVILRFI